MKLNIALKAPKKGFAIRKEKSKINDANHFR